MQTSFRAVVLAAGLGRRLRPLTSFLPKPLLPIAGGTVVGQTLDRLSALGCGAAALNLHHLGDAVRQRFGGSHEGMPLTYSPEERLLGTLGALAPLREFLAEAQLVVVVNGDSLCRWPIAELIRRHRRSAAVATLALSKRAPLEEFSPVGVDVEGRVISFGGDESFGEEDRRRVFAGAHVFSPELVADLEVEPAEFVPDLYLPILRQGGRLQGYEFTRPWHDLGTPRRYLAAARDWSRRARGGSRPGRRAWVAPGGHVDPAATVRGSVVERGARVEAGAEVEESLVLPGAVIGERCEVRRSIIGVDTELPSGTAIDQRLVTHVRADVKPGDEDSIVGGLIYTRLR